MENRRPEMLAAHTNEESAIGIEPEHPVERGPA